MNSDVFENGESIRKFCLENRITIAEAMQRREEYLSEMTRAEIRAEMYKNLVVMRDSVRKGLSERVESVSGFSGVTAPIWQAKASRKVPYVPMTTCSPPKSRTALRMARDVEARLAEGTPPIAKQLKSPCHPRMFIKETTRSSVMFVNRHSKANRSMVVSSVWPDKRSRMSACSEFITVHSNRRICELPHVRRPFRSPFAQWR